MGRQFVKRDVITREREDSIVKFLYDEGPHTRAQIADHEGIVLSTMSTILVNMQHSGRINKERIRGGEFYYLLTEEETIAYERDNLQADEQRSCSDLVRTA